MSRWELIETAKKNGRMILIADDRIVMPGYWNAGDRRWHVQGVGRMGNWQPTHWRPWPKPPRRNVDD